MSTTYAKVASARSARRASRTGGYLGVAALVGGTAAIGVAVAVFLAPAQPRVSPVSESAIGQERSVLLEDVSTAPPERLVVGASALGGFPLASVDASTAPPERALQLAPALAAFPLLAVEPSTAPPERVVGVVESAPFRPLAIDASTAPPERTAAPATPPFLAEDRSTMPPERR